MHHPPLPGSSPTLLINPPVRVEEIYGKYQGLASFHQPIGLCSLAARLDESRRETEILDACVLQLSLAATVKAVKDKNPRRAGIYCNTPNFPSVARLTEELKRECPRLRIVLGGPHPTFMPEESLTATSADFAVVGEGEETLRELVAAQEGPPDILAGIPGLAWRDGGGTIRHNPARPLLGDLDQLPFPALQLLPPLNRYRLYLLQYRRLPFVTVATSRGCPYQCVFCNTPFGAHVRYHSPRYVVAYLAHLAERFGVKEIHFCDDTFTQHEPRVHEICDRIRESRLDLTWYAAVRANVHDYAIFADMKRAGCWIAALGVESGDEEVLRKLGKKITLEQIKETSRAILRAGLRLKTFFILGSPGDTVATIEKTIALAVALKSDFPVFSFMVPYPGTRLWQEADRHGHFDRSSYQKLLLAGSDPVFVPYGLTREALVALQKKAFRRTYLTGEMFRRVLLRSLSSPGDLLRLGKAFLIFLKIMR